MSIADPRRELEALHKESFGWTLRCCAGNRALAEDVLQTVYLKVLDGKATFGGRSSFKTWLFAVIRTTAANERRQKFLRQMFLTDSLDSYQNTVSEASESMGNDESVATLKRALATLSLRQQEVLHLVFYQDLSLSEAAEAMQISVGSARTHYERGKKNLRHLIEQLEGRL